MEHSFDIDVAVEYGINAAILLKNIYYWCEHHRANNKHFYEGFYWTFNSGKAFHDLFPYLSEKQIRSALKKLEDEGLIISGNFNKSSYDRTRWYAVTQKGTSILQKGKMEEHEVSNGSHEKVEPIPDIITDINKQNINTDVNDIVTTSKTKESKSKYGEYHHVLLTDTEYERLINDFGVEGTHDRIKILDEAIETKGYKYKNCNLVLRGWVSERYAEIQRKTRSNTRGYDWENL